MRNIFSRIGSIFKKSKHKAGGNDSQKLPAINTSLKQNLEILDAIAGGSDDLKVREIEIGGKAGLRAALVFIDGLINKTIINRDILKPLMKPDLSGALRGGRLVETLKDKIITADDVSTINSFDDVITHVYSGDSVLLVDGSAAGLAVSTKGWKERSVDEPKTEATIRGIREGFIETLRTNTALVRRHLRDPNLKVENFKSGRRSKIDGTIMYLKGVANPALVEEVKNRLKVIDVDLTMETAAIEQFIEDDHSTIFPLVDNSERTDKVAAALAEGRVVIFLDGSPFALIVPVTLDILFHSSEDYYHRWPVATGLRIIRFLASLIAFTGPSLYIALTSFHPELIPLQLAMTIATGREGIPLPAFVEAFLMEFSIEILREAGLRLPSPIGQTVGIVGGLVVGEAAVSAGIASPAMVVVVAMTAIASYSAPNYEVALAFRLVRFGLMVLAAVFGLYGFTIGALFLITHMASLKSFGVPFLSSYSPFILRDLKDSFVVVPRMMMRTRPLMYNTVDDTRLDLKGDKEGEGERGDRYE